MAQLFAAYDSYGWDWYELPLNALLALDSELSRILNVWEIADVLACAMDRDILDMEQALPDPDQNQSHENYPTLRDHPDYGAPSIVPPTRVRSMSYVVPATFIVIITL